MRRKERIHPLSSAMSCLSHACSCSAWTVTEMVTVTDSGGGDGGAAAAPWWQDVASTAGCGGRGRGFPPPLRENQGSHRVHGASYCVSRGSSESGGANISPDVIKRRDAVLLV